MSIDKDAEIERLKATIADGLKYTSEVDTNNTILRARLDTYEQQLRAYEAQLTEANEKYEGLEEMYDELYKHHHETIQHPSAPTIIKQTWQGIYPKYGLGGQEGMRYYVSKTGCDNGDLLIGVLHRDHYSDGSVKATLEPVEGTK